MAVQIRYPDDTRQWVPGILQHGREMRNGDTGRTLHFTRYNDGFSVYDPKSKNRTEFGPDIFVISMTPDSNVIDWSRRPGWQP